MMRFAKLIGVLGGSAVLLAGCGKAETTSTTDGSDAAAVVPTTRPIPSPGGAPTYGTPSGMGFSTGDAAHSDGQGSGLMGYHKTGAEGTSGAITDQHPYSKPTNAATEPVLPPQ